MNHLTPVNLKILKERYTLCNAPFENHHHKHITRDGIYHTSCYKNRKFSKYSEGDKDFIEAREDIKKLLNK